MGTEAKQVNPLELSDDEFLKMNGPPEASGEASSADEVEQKQEEDTGQQTEAGTEGADTVQGTDTENGTDTLSGSSTEGDTSGTDALGGESGEDKLDVAAKAEDKKEVPAEDKKTEAEPVQVNYEDSYKKIMAPFKANGKTIELRSPEEAIQLMQMGANYTRKMQELVPHRKVMTMLQNNGLLDESKLSFLIDLDKKNPEAIKKLIKDSGIDPLDIDTSAEPAYLEGNHRVTDEEVNFATALEELSSNPTGKETLRDINTRWDQASKDLLWKHPETMAIIHAQREAGIYGRIVEEMDRQKLLGKIPPETPFVQAYKIVGDELTAANAFADLAQKQEPTPSDPAVKREDPKVVATRAAAPKSPVSNDDKASAATPDRSTPKQVKEVINPLAMSDDEFLKRFEGRL